MELFASARPPDPNPIPQIISVAIPRPINRLFTYRLPPDLAPRAQIGQWAKVPFGQRVIYAYIVEPPKVLKSEEEMAWPLKDVISIHEGDPIFSQEILDLCRWVHNYYSVPLGEVLNCAIPSATFKKVKARKKSDRTKTLPPLPVHVLNQEQRVAVEQLERLRKAPGAGTSLLHGITGSGKTEVYIDIARKTLLEGRGVLILVPEIALTSHLHRQFEDRLGFRVGLWHSALAVGKRIEQMEALRRGEIKVLIGARSAIFAPIQHLGLIVVDEEHDSGYKQEDRVRYQARDLAVVRGKMTQSLVLLGSATPSLETRERVREGRYSQSTLTQRVTGGTLPSVEIIDLKTEYRRPDIQANLSPRVIESLKSTLAAGEQAIIYLNRRGFAAFLLCQDCGEVKGCPECSVSLTLYKRRGMLCCHMCGHQEIIPSSCPQCAGYQLKAMGAGTESLEEELPRLIPEAKIARLDRDQVTSVQRLESVLDQFRRGESNILLGTQMLVKGHDFPHVTLVVVVSADALFRWPDFRASERAYQVLQQVAGRTGRGIKPGKVLIQAYDVDHPVLRVLTDFSAETDFLESERQVRQALGYPPFGRLAKIRFENRNRIKTIEHANETAQMLQRRLQTDLPRLELLGPSEALMEKVKGIYRWDILLKSKDIQVLQRAIHLAQDFSSQAKWSQMFVDIDPYSV